MVTELRNPPTRPERRPPRGLRHATGRLLPTLATLGNLICGFGAIYYSAKAGATWSLSGEFALGSVTYFTVAGWLIFLAMVFDALDGRLARMARTTSDLGAQLDSLADVVSFGLAPALLMLQLLAVRIHGEWFHDQWIGTEDGVRLIGRAVWVIGAIFAACTALRLARFNVETTADESAHMWFKGLPSPGAAAALTSLAILMEEFVRRDFPNRTVQAMFWLLPPVALAVALMMVSSVPYPHALNHLLRRGRHPFRNLVIALLALGTLMVLKYIALAVAAVGFALSGPAILFYRRIVKKDYRSPDELAEELADELVPDEDEQAEE